jgi:hypothetical protein
MIVARSVIGLLVLVYSAGLAQAQHDCVLKVPARKTVNMRITFHTSWETNLIVGKVGLFDLVKTEPIAQWNNYFEPPGHRLATPYRTFNWTTQTPDSLLGGTSFSFDSKHKRGGPSGEPFFGAERFTRTDVPASATRGAYTLLKWGDSSASPDAVTVEVTITDATTAATKNNAPGVSESATKKPH